MEHADADLYAGRQIILTPIERTLTNQLQKAVDVWTALGCRVLKMSPEQHDAAFAAVSHLPHLLAFAYQAKGDATRDIVYYEFGPDGKKLVETWFQMPYAACVHDFGVTDEWIVFPFFPIIRQVMLYQEDEALAEQIRARVLATIGTGLSSG